jgi:hypothetical protein
MLAIGITFGKSKHQQCASPAITPQVNDAPQRGQLRWPLVGFQVSLVMGNQVAEAEAFVAQHFLTY